MRTKKAFSFDEEKDAWEIIQGNFSGSPIDYGKMYSVAKYFRKNMGYGEIRLEKKLIEFCKECDPSFNPILEAEYIKKWIKVAMNYGLRKIDSLYLTDKEIRFLNDIENIKERKILYATLVLAKAIRKKGNNSSNYCYIHYSNILDVPRLARIDKMSEIAICKIYYKYKNNLTFYSANKELIRVDFADLEGEEKAQITNLDNIMEAYDELFGKPKYYCQNCGKEFLRKANNQILCADCSRQRLREKKKNFMRKKRNVEKLNPSIFNG